MSNNFLKLKFKTLKYQISSSNKRFKIKMSIFRLNNVFRIEILIFRLKNNNNLEFKYQFLDQISFLILYNNFLN